LSDVTAVKFHPNSKYLFTGSADHKIRMHDISNAQLVRTFHGHTDTVTCFDISHCGKLLVSGSKDKHLILWDIQNGKSLIKFPGHGLCSLSPSLLIIFEFTFTKLGVLLNLLALIV